MVTVKVHIDRHGGIPKSLLLECVRVVLLLWRLEIQLPFLKAYEDSMILCK